MRNVVVGLLVVSLVAPGCVNPDKHAGREVARYPRVSGKPDFGWINHAAVFVLLGHQPPSDPAVARRLDDGWELGRWRLKKRSPLGFKLVNGQLVAVAGADEVRLPPGNYTWHVRPGSEPVDWLATGALVGVGFVVFCIVAVVYANDHRND